MTKDAVSLDAITSFKALTQEGLDKEDGKASLLLRGRIGRLNDLMYRKGRKASALINNASSEPPMSASTVNGWLNGRVKKPKRDQLVWAFRELRSLPDKRSSEPTLAKAAANLDVVITAREILMSADRFIRNQKRDPDPHNETDMLCGRPASIISTLFNNGHVSGLEDYGIMTNAVQSLPQFISAARTAGHLKPLPPQ